PALLAPAAAMLSPAFVLLSLALGPAASSAVAAPAASAPSPTKPSTVPAASARPAADLILIKGRVFTGDPAKPEAEAIAVLGDRIVAVGTGAEIEAWRGPKTRVIDAAYRRVLPGFNDAHVHFIAGGMDLDNVDLKNTKTPQEF